MNQTKDSKIKEFEIKTQEEYSRDRRVHKYCNILQVEDTRGEFMQIGLRPQLEMDIFDPNSGTYPHIIGLGTSIARGEENYFVENTLKNFPSETRKISELTPQFLSKICTRFGHDKEIVILAPFWFEHEHLAPEHKYVDYEYDQGTAIIRIKGTNIKIYGVNERVIGDNLIIFDKYAIRWKYRIFPSNKLLEIKIRLNADTMRYDTIVRSLIKQEFLNRNAVKVIKIEK